MKKIFAILLGLSVLGIVAAGCSGGGDAAGETTGETGGAAPKPEGE